MKIPFVNKNLNFGLEMGAARGRWASGEFDPPQQKGCLIYSMHITRKLPLFHFSLFVKHFGLSRILNNINAP